MKTAYVTKSFALRKALKRDLKDDCMVFGVGQSRSGYRFDCILLLSLLETDQEKDWWQTFMQCLAPGGEIIYSGRPV